VTENEQSSSAATFSSGVIDLLHPLLDEQPDVARCASEAIRPPLGPPTHVRVRGLEVGPTHVLVGYRSPASELAAAEPLIEHVLASVRKR
jgi:hypothetical protein